MEKLIIDQKEQNRESKPADVGASFALRSYILGVNSGALESVAVPSESSDTSDFDLSSFNPALL